MLLLSSLLALTVNGAQRYSYGGCNSQVYTPSNQIPCKTECTIDNVGRTPQVRTLKYMMQTENTLAADITLKGGKAYTKNKKPYIGLIRLEKKFCKTKILEAIEDGYLRFDIGDKSDKSYYIDAITYDRQGGTLQSAVVQFRKRQISGEAELWNSKLKVDRFYMTMSGFAEGMRPDFFQNNAGKPYLLTDFKKCFAKANFMTMKDDGAGKNGGDYTKCAAYKHYGMDVDWTEYAEETTTPEPVTTETTVPEVTTLPAGDDDNLIPEGVKCNGNAVSPSRIVGGDDAVPHSWPWAVRVRLGWGSCGGTILNNNHVMCAAHCCDGKSAASTTVTIGEHDVTTGDGERTIQATKLIMHPKYGENDGYTYNWDFCIIKTEPMNLDGDNSDIVCLPEQGEHVLPTHDGQRLKGKHCYVAGWGTLSSGGSTPTVLQSVKIDIFSHNYCVDNSQYGNMFDEVSEFCAGNMNGGTDSCQGDSGGPVICIDHENQPVLYGVVSWGYGCAASGYPGIYGKVSAVVDWIENVVNEVETTPQPTTTAPPDASQLIPEGTRCSSGNQFFENKQGKIIGGETTVENSWPWIAHLKFGSRLCAGTIINNNHVLTAAHCCTDVSSASEITLRVGVHDSTYTSGEKTIDVEDIMVHDKFFEEDRYTYNYDVCLLRTADIGINGENIDVVCLPEQGDHVGATGGMNPQSIRPTPNRLVGDNCFVAGWGSLELGGAYPTKLQSFKANVYSHSYCESQSSYTSPFEEATEFCAGQMSGGQDACSGDAGAPLVCLDGQGEPYLYGLATWGVGCAYENYPGIYAKTAAFIDWIANKIDPSYTTAPPPTPEPSSNLIPDGVKCNGNALSKIVNGDDAKKNSWPWIVGVRMGGYMCGGSILSKDYVMTAAHCCEGFGPSDVYVIAGDHNNQVSDGEKRYDAKKVIMHPKYGESDGYTYNYDFCLLQVEEIDLNGETMDIVCMPEQGEHVEPTVDGQKLKGKQCFVGGWGTTSSGGSLAATLQSVNVNIYSHNYCMSQSSYSGGIDPVSEFCAGKIEGGIDSCQGDSGGPLICIDDDMQPVLYGVVSWGRGCAWDGYPGIYAKMSAVVDWVKTETATSTTTAASPTATSGTATTGTQNTATAGTTSYQGEPDWETGDKHLQAGLSCDNPAASVFGNKIVRKRRYATKGKNKNQKIVGGSIVQRGHWPWIVRLHMGCGGSILNSEWILTAAHCCDGFSVITVYVGDWNRWEDDEGEFSVRTDKIIIHENYGDLNGISNDICLLKVPDLNNAQEDSCKTAVNGGPCFAPVCLPKMNGHAAPGRHCWVAGWGTLSSGGSSPSKLHDVGINIMPGGYCLSHGGYDEQFGSNAINFESEFCAGIPDHDGDGDIDGGIDSCQGDSGGPVVCNDNGQPVLYGVVSWGIGCAGRNFPGVYAKVSAFVNWIDQKMATN